MQRHAVQLFRQPAQEVIMKLHISVARQVMTVFDDHDEILREYPVSTAKAGVGEVSGSYQTPRGRHLIRAKIGTGQPENTVFVRRRPTGEIWTPALGKEFPGRDWILTRILWLSGREPGCNRLGCVDTMRRYIYIHGSPDSAEMGLPGSHGCIRMRNGDIVEFFDLVPCYTEVEISED
jgi:lipoprotein-anchoring transpeptidase ErfK/SrfK